MKPIPINNPDLADLIEATKEYVDYLNSEDYCDDGASDYKHEIFEVAMKTVFGPNIWDWIYERLEHA
jgi:hypothetical protein